MELKYVSLFPQKLRFQKIQWPEILRNQDRTHGVEKIEDVKFFKSFFEDLDSLLHFRGY